MPLPPAPRDENSRLVAARILLHWTRHGDMPGRLLEAESQDRAFITEMVLGVVRGHLALDWMISRLAERHPPPDLQAVLLVGLYQLMMLDHVEPYAAVHETVEAAKTLCGPKKAPFVNALLRRAQREKADLLARLQKQPLWIQHGHPKELWDRWVQRFGQADTVQLCQWNNQRPELTLRVRPMISREDFVAVLRDEGVGVQPSPAHPDFVVLPEGCRIEACPGYRKGWFTVQDPATLAAVDRLAPQPGERILDACAAPGGKTIAIADRLAGTGYVVASDRNPARLDRVHENLARCGLTDQVHVQCANAIDPSPDWFDGTGFDAVLLDVPCSNTGVIRRRPDARQRLTPTHLKQLLILQAQILDGAVALVRPGGRLVYSTCSLEQEENEQQVAAFLKRHREFTLDGESSRFPPRDQMDGAYAACLVRKKPG